VKSVWKSILACVFIVMMMAGLASAQTFTHFNPGPCDFSDLFYQQSGIVVGQGTGVNATVAGRFGNSGPAGRQFGPPSTSPTQANWVADPSCATNDPTRRNFRILATTGGYPDDNSGNSTDFISILAFLTKQSDDFETSFSGSEGDNPITITNGANPRGIAMVDVVSHFEAYGPEKQTIPAGQPFAGSLAPTPCGVNLDPNVPAGTPCFPVAVADANGVSANLATPNLRQDWRFASNRNSIDLSDGNCITKNDQLCKGKGTFSDSPFGYFCDDLLGMWIVTYFWYTHHAVGNPFNGEKPDQAQCVPMLNQLAKQEGTNLDGTPIVRTADQLNFLEGKVTGTEPIAGFPNPPSFTDGEGCLQEGQEDVNGGDSPATVWLVCPAIPDPRNGGIASDAFLDAVRFPNGSFVDDQQPTTRQKSLSQNFACLQQTGKFCNE
jgi:hypothetical protein